MEYCTHAKEAMGKLFEKSQTKANLGMQKVQVLTIFVLP